MSTDPCFVDKAHDVVGLYLGPPERALVFRVDEKPQIQSLEKDIRTWIAARNTGPRPYVWTGTTDEILERLAGCLNRIPDSED